MFVCLLVMSVCLSLTVKEGTEGEVVGRNFRGKEGRREEEGKGRERNLPVEG